MKKIAHYTFAIETEDSIHPEVIAEELEKLFDPFCDDDGHIKGCLREVKSDDWNKQSSLGIRPVKIAWIDSCASNQSWSLISELDGEIEPIKIISYGTIVQETDDCVTIAQNYGLNPEQFCNLMTIPRGCIKEIVEINV